MFPVPYRKILIVSPHSVDVVAERLQLHSSRRWPWFRAPVPQFDFVGSVSPKTFRLLPSRRGRNTYTPWLRGRLTPLPDGTKIKLVQTLHPAGIVIIVGLVILALVLWSRTEYIGGAGFFTAGLLVLHGVLYCMAFLPQARRAERSIRQLAV